MRDLGMTGIVVFALGAIVVLIISLILGSFVLLLGVVFLATGSKPPQDDVNCPSCGVNHPRSATFCNKCGKSLRPPT